MLMDTQSSGLQKNVRNAKAVKKKSTRFVPSHSANGFVITCIRVLHSVIPTQTGTYVSIFIGYTL